MPLVGRGDGALVAVVSRERGEVYRLRDGRLVALADHTEEQPRRHDQGGWSQARFQRHIDELASEHLRNVADEINRQVRSSENGIQVVVVCAEENRGEFAELLSQEAQARLSPAGRIAEAHAPPAELLEAVTPVLEEWPARREPEVLERWREEAAGTAAPSSGWRRRLDAASDARVDVLLFQEGANREAYQCPTCGRAAVEPGSCPLDGTRLRASATRVDLAVHADARPRRHRAQASATGGTSTRRGHRRAAALLAGCGRVHVAERRAPCGSVARASPPDGARPSAADCAGRSIGAGAQLISPTRCRAR